jgi:hypothetical protein
MNRVIHFGFIKMYRISWLPKEILVSEEGLFSCTYCSVSISPISIQRLPIDFALNDGVLHGIAFNK